MTYRVLVVDDEENIRGTISDILKDESYDVITASDGEEAQKKVFLEDIDAVILDVLLPKKGGMDVLSYIHKEFPIVPVIIITGHGDIKMAVEAMKRGAFDFIEKPLSMERIIGSVRNAITMKELQMENVSLKSRFDRPVAFVGETPGVKSILATIPQIAQSEASVLVTGENGTGKELVARMIHQESTRRKYPFIGVNCAAIPDTLIESELFGYEKGAFTGATKQKKGKFETANRGTIFLDEVADLSQSAQAKVLRVIQEREIERVGGNETVKVDVRIVAATNKDLGEEIKAGRFRQDLFYRLNVVPIQVPPLRERKDDIEALARFFIEEITEKTGRPAEFTPAAFQSLKSRKWPGNVRELRNFIERLLILSAKSVIDAQDVLQICYPEESSIESRFENQNLKDAKHEFERNLIISRLVKFNNNITKTAESLDIERTYLHKKIKELGIDSEIQVDD